jgi:hypothetical protein
MRTVTRALYQLPIVSLLLGASCLHAQGSTIQHRTQSIGTWQCEANWDQDCEDAQVLSAPEGWQVCRLTFTEVTRDGWDAWFNHEPTSFFTNDPETPDRYRAVRIAIHAFGTGNPFDQRGSKMRVDNIVLDMIPASAGRYERYAASCDMPQHD